MQHYDKEEGRRKWGPCFIYFLLLYSLAAKTIWWIHGVVKRMTLQLPIQRRVMLYPPLMRDGTFRLNGICQQNIHSIRTCACLLKALILISLIKEVCIIYYRVYQQDKSDEKFVKLCLHSVYVVQISLRFDDFFWQNSNFSNWRFSKLVGTSSINKMI